MYSGTTFSKYSGNIVGAHQKFDKVARKHLAKLSEDDTVFPPIKLILHFEGREGPDGIKRKSPSQDEPWHFLDPFDDNDTQLTDLIQDHYTQLVAELRSGSVEHQAFEAAWLAHAIVDGLTPAHHYPYEREYVRLSSGRPITDRTTFKKKLVMPGDTRLEWLGNNIKAYGPRGLRTAHGFFELGVAAIIAPLGFSETLPSAEEVSRTDALEVPQLFRDAAREIGVLDMYSNYCKKGWTPRLTWQVRHRLAPIIIRTLTLTWYRALQEARHKQ